MKTKTFLLICLFSGIATTQLSAQLPPVIPDGTKSVVWTFSGLWEEYISCTGVEDYLSGIVTLVETDLFKNGEIIRGINHGGGILTNENGDEFEIHLNIKGQLPLDPDGNYTNGTYHYNIVGENGTLYIGTCSFYNTEPYFTIDKAICPGKGNK
jgi:hypothetical protein